MATPAQRAQVPAPQPSNEYHPQAEIVPMRRGRVRNQGEGAQPATVPPPAQPQAPVPRPTQQRQQPQSVSSSSAFDSAFGGSVAPAASKSFGDAFGDAFGDSFGGPSGSSGSSPAAGFDDVFGGAPVVSQPPRTTSSSSPLDDAFGGPQLSAPILSDAFGGPTPPSGPARASSPFGNAFGGSFQPSTSPLPTAMGTAVLVDVSSAFEDPRPSSRAPSVDGSLTRQFSGVQLAESPSTPRRKKVAGDRASWVSQVINQKSAYEASVKS